MAKISEAEHKKRFGMQTLDEIVISGQGEELEEEEEQVENEGEDEFGSWELVDSNKIYPCPTDDGGEYLIENEEGERVRLNKPFRTSKGPKKFAVHVKNDKGNVVLVRFGDSDMEIKRDDPERRKSFRARHKCDNPGPKWKPRFWSCKFWSSKSVSDLLGNYEGQKKKDDDDDETKSSED